MTNKKNTDTNPKTQETQEAIFKEIILYIKNNPTTIQSMWKRLTYTDEDKECKDKIKIINTELGAMKLRAIWDTYQKKVVNEIFNDTDLNLDEKKELTDKQKIEIMKKRNIEIATIQNNFLLKGNKTRDNKLCYLYSNLLVADETGEMIKQFNELKAISDKIKAQQALPSLFTNFRRPPPETKEISNNDDANPNIGGKTSRKKSTRKRKQKKSKKSRSKKI